MYSGSHAITMDAKGRLAIPSRIRDQLVADCGGRIVVTAHHEERCLLVYPESQWQTLAPQVQALPNIQSASVRKLQRRLLGHAVPLELDANGRILLPPTLRDFAGLDKDLIVAGLGHRLEIWNEAAWAASNEDDSDSDELPPAALLLNI
ncbi:MAG: cell division/cell wall cluster transcriptional repressor MraZ [Verrucomicrobiaceae bacterium]|nr:cell division/cell wall cluster transcriptional repressor MraZ [Verrucomicrobiaceae bacterium]